MQVEFFSGLDPTLFRMYHSRLYRWMTPDPVAGDVTNPQSLPSTLLREAEQSRSLNRYAYVLNNPANLNASPALQRDSIVSSAYLRNQEAKVE